VTNTLAYYENSQITDKKSFITFVPGRAEHLVVAGRSRLARPEIRAAVEGIPVEEILEEEILED
jgi:hypothetical protein